MTPELRMLLDTIYTIATDHRTSDTYASSLRRKARRHCIAAGLPVEEWPPWTASGAHWTEPVSRDEPVEYPPGLTPEAMDALELFRVNNNPAEARMLCRALDIEPPPWARR